MLKDIMYVLNYFAISWIFLAFFWILISLVFRVKNNKSNFKVSIFITIISFSIFAFNYEPTVYTDLYRHYEILNLMRSYGTSFYYSYEIITSFLFSMVARTNYNELLPFLITIIRYSLFFFLLYKYIKTYKIESYYTKLFIFFHFAFFPLIESISGIRYYFAITVIAYALLNEFFLKKKLINKMLLFVPMLIHTSSSMFLAIGFLNIRKFRYLVRFLLLSWTFFYLEIAKILQNIGFGFTNTTANLIISYIEEDRTISLRLTIARLAILLLILIMFWMLKRRDQENYMKNIKYYNYMELLLYFTIGSIFQSVFFQRNIFFIALMCMPLFFNTFHSKFISQKIKIIYIIFILILSIGMYLNQIYGLIFGYF